MKAIKRLWWKFKRWRYSMRRQWWMKINNIPKPKVRMVTPPRKERK